MSKTIIVGKTSYIAQRLRQYLNNNYISLTRNDCNDKERDNYFDLLHPMNFDYEIIKPGDFIIFFAAISSPDICEKHYTHAYQINVVGTKYFIEKALNRGARVLFFSSDMVYGNYPHLVFDELSKPDPIGRYAQMKLEVEESFRAYDNFYVFRLSYVFSKDDKFTKYLISCFKNGLPADVFSSLYRNVIYIEDVIQAILVLEKNNSNHKLFNLSGIENLSRLDLANLLKSGVYPQLEIRIVEPENSFFEYRPPKIQTKSIHLESLLNRSPLTIKEAIKLEFKEII